MKSVNRLVAVSALSLCLTSPAGAQEHDHSQMDHAAMDPAPAAEAEMALPAPSLPADGSGTSRLPANDSGMTGLHIPTGDWMVMAHGYVSPQYTNHGGPRGSNKFYATSMFMVSGEKEADWGRFQLRSMLSLEPAMDARGYPNLFATGETADGVPLVDRQHPHDLFMELAARIDFNIGEDTRLFLYGGPVGEPAIGPSAFMHRGSAEYNPEAPITHHWFDSTHITYGVLTGGVSGSTWQLEASTFRGEEPDEQRWGIEKPKLDSWSIRGTINPAPDWALQASYARIKQPEVIHPGQDEHRYTASSHYANGSGLSAMLAFSAKERIPGDTLTAWLAEANWNMDEANTIFGRFENASSDELFPDHHAPLHDTVFRISKFQAGYARRMHIGPLEVALGGSLSVYSKPDALDGAYGNDPVGYTVFTRISLGG